MKSSQIAPMTAQTILKYCAKTVPFLLATPLSLMPFNGINAIALESINVEPIAVESINVELVAVESINVEPIAVESINVEPIAIASTDLEIDSAMPVSAASFGSQALDEIHIHFNEPLPPPGQRSPRGRQAGGAGRGKCGDYEGLTALMPVIDDRVWGQTTTDQPTLWFYSPAAFDPRPIDLIGGARSIGPLSLPNDVGTKHGSRASRYPTTGGARG